MRGQSAVKVAGEDVTGKNERNGLKRVQSRGEERVRWPGGRRRGRAEKQKSRRGGGGKLMKQKAGLFLL